MVRRHADRPCHVCGNLPALQIFFLANAPSVVSPRPSSATTLEVPFAAQFATVANSLEPGARQTIWGLAPFLLVGLGADSLDGIDRDQWQCEHVADARYVVGTIGIGEEAVIADAMEALREDVHQEAANELTGLQSHDLVAARCWPGLSDDEIVIMPVDVVIPVDVSPDCEGA